MRRLVKPARIGYFSSHKRGGVLLYTDQGSIHILKSDYPRLLSIMLLDASKQAVKTFLGLVLMRAVGKGITTVEAAEAMLLPRALKAGRS